MSTTELAQEQKIQVGGLQINGETPTVSKDVMENIAAGGFNLYGSAKVGIHQGEDRKVVLVRHSDSSVLASVIGDALDRGDKVVSQSRQESRGHLAVKETSFKKIGPVLFGVCRVEHTHEIIDPSGIIEAKRRSSFISVGSLGIKRALGISKNTPKTSESADGSNV